MSFDPEIGPRNVPFIEESAPGVFFICDEDGPVEHSECDSGPFSLLFDAQYSLHQFFSYLEDEYVSSHI
jgi:hypothetical protein